VPGPADRRSCRSEAPIPRSTRPAAEGSVRRIPVPTEAVLIAVRWYLRYGLSYRDLEELLAERGIEVDHVTLFPWVQRFTPLLIDAARPCRHRVGSHWLVDETYVSSSAGRVTPSRWFSVAPAVGIQNPN